MATVNNVRLNNLAAGDAQIVFNWWWNLTRSMKDAGWKFKASSNGTTKISNSDPAADQFGTGTVSNVGAAAASITAIANGRATVTGLTGIVADDKGRFLTITGAASAANNNHHQIEEILSTTSVRIDARNFVVVAPDANNGALTWTIRNTVGDVYSSFTALQTTVAWWCAQGPSILRIPITSAAVGTFLRGENITQSTTGAEGEFIGYIFSAGAGYLVVAPRLRGSGTGVHGWQTAFTVTGANSAATVTQVGTAIDYVYEMVFAKTAANTTFQIFVGQFDTVADAAEMFSFCATQAGCTAAIHPGGGGTGNAFGTNAWVVWGSSTTPGSGIAMSGTGTFHRGHTICVDAISEAGYTADGSWSLIYSAATPGTNPPGFDVFGFQKLNDTEEGDLSPYATTSPSTLSSGRLGAGSAVVADTNWIQTSSWVFQGWRRRGLSGTTAEVTFTILYSAHLVSSGLGAVPVMSFLSPIAYRISTGIDSTARVREPIWLVGGFNTVKFFKGTLKWVYWFSSEQVTDVFGTDPAWVQIGTGTASGAGASIGPSDGTGWVLNA
jgi:hypothetical protein